MAKSGAKMMMSRYIRQNGGTAALPTDVQVRHMKQMDADRLFYEVAFGNYISGRALAYDRKWLQEQGGFDENYRLLEDLPLILKSLRRGIRPGVFEEIAIAYEGGGVSEGGRMNPILGDDHMRILESEILPTVKYGGKTITNYYEMMCGKRQLGRMEWAAVRAKRKMMLALNCGFYVNCVLYLTGGSKMINCGILQFKDFSDGRGHLTPIESASDIPFE